MNILDIIDSAIKIGLGGFIGWASSYTVSKLKYDREKEKYLLDKKLSVYESSVDELEIYLDKLSRLFSYIGGVQKSSLIESEYISLNDKQLSILRSRNAELVESWSSRRKALTRLKLLGANEIEDLLYELKNIEKEFRSTVVFGEMNISKMKIDKIREDKEIVVESIRKKLAEFYGKLMT